MLPIHTNTDFRQADSQAASGTAFSQGISGLYVRRWLSAFVTCSQTVKDRDASRRSRTALSVSLARADNSSGLFTPSDWSHWMSVSGWLWANEDNRARFPLSSVCVSVSRAVTVPGSAGPCISFVFSFRQCIGVFHTQYVIEMKQPKWAT